MQIEAISQQKQCVKEPNSAKYSDIESCNRSNDSNVVDIADHRIAQSSKTTPRKPKNTDVREREYLTEDEVKRLRDAARKSGRNGSRDALIVLLMYRHGLLVSELIDLTWQQISFDDGTIHIRRKKNGKASTHNLEGDEIRALRKLKRNQSKSLFIFMSERKAPLSARSVQTMIDRAGEVAELGMPIHPHMLRHSCGYGLANAGATTRDIQDYLGHVNIQHTVTYTALSSDRFKSFGAILGG